MNATLQTGLKELGERARAWVKKVHASALLRVAILTERSEECREAIESKEVDRWMNEGGSTSAQ